MPFDGANFRDRREEPGRAARRERIWAVVVVVSAALMLVMPVSAEGLIDLVHYLRGG